MRKLSFNRLLYGKGERLFCWKTVLTLNEEPFSDEILFLNWKMRFYFRSVRRLFGHDFVLSKRPLCLLMSKTNFSTLYVNIDVAANADIERYNAAKSIAIFSFQRLLYPMNDFFRNLYAVNQWLSLPYANTMETGKRD